MKKVLIVDDTRTVHNFVKSLVKDEGFEFSDAFNGQEALEILQTESFDLILLDWEMPVLNGPETLKQIMEKHAEIPVVMMTTKNAFEDVSTMLQAGAKEYLMKPFTKDVFLEKIGRVDEDEGFDYAI